MKTKLLWAGALLLLGTAASATPAAAWDLLGERVISDRVDHDAIWVRGHERYREIKLCVYRRPIRMRDLDVNFQNGGHQDVAVRAVINDGSCTRNIDLNGRRRDIKNIQMTYETAGWTRGRTATVRVFGR